MTIINTKNMVGGALIIFGMALSFLQHRKEDIIAVACEPGGSTTTCSAVGWALEMKGIGSIGWLALLAGIFIVFFYWLIIDVFVKVLLFMLNEKEKVVSSVHALVADGKLTEVERRNIATSCFSPGTSDFGESDYGAFVFDQVSRTLLDAGRCWRSSFSMVVTITEPSPTENHLKDYLVWSEKCEFKVKSTETGGSYNLKTYSEIEVEPKDVAAVLGKVSYEVMREGIEAFSFQKTIDSSVIAALLKGGEHTANGCFMKYNGRILTFGSKVSVKIGGETSIVVMERSFLRKDDNHSTVSFREPTKGCSIQYHLPPTFTPGTVSFSPRKYRFDGTSSPIVEEQSDQLYMSTSGWVLPGIVSVASWVPRK